MKIRHFINVLLLIHAPMTQTIMPMPVGSPWVKLAAFGFETPVDFQMGFSLFSSKVRSFSQMDLSIKVSYSNDLKIA